jgi:hypothetical protein
MPVTLQVPSRIALEDIPAPCSLSDFTLVTQRMLTAIPLDLQKSLNAPENLRFRKGQGRCNMSPDLTKLHRFPTRGKSSPFDASPMPIRDFVEFNMFRSPRSRCHQPVRSAEAQQQLEPLKSRL